MNKSKNHQSTYGSQRLYASEACNEISYMIDDATVCVPVKGTATGKKTIKIVTLFVAYCFVLLIMSGCGKSVLSSQSAAVLNRSLPDETSTDVNIFSYKENRIDYLLTAAKIERFYNLKRLWAWKVKITTYDEKGVVKSTMIADTTFVDEARNYIKAIGNVVLTSPNGTIQSHIITWDRNIDEIYCPEKVVLIRDGNTLIGDNLRTDANITFAEMNSVSAQGTIKGDEVAW